MACSLRLTVKKFRLTRLLGRIWAISTCTYLISRRLKYSTATFSVLKSRHTSGRVAGFLATGDYHHHIAINNWAGKTPAPKNAAGLISYRLTVPEMQVLANLEERAWLLGYEARLANDILQIRDPNGHWLELEAVSNTAAVVA